MFRRGEPGNAAVAWASEVQACRPGPVPPVGQLPRAHPSHQAKMPWDNAALGLPSAAGFEVGHQLVTRKAPAPESSWAAPAR